MRAGLDPGNWTGWPVIWIGWLLAQLPHRLALRIGAGIGRLSYHLLRGRRLVAQTNIAACFPQLDAGGRQRLVKQTFAETGMGLVDTAIALWRSDSRLQELTNIIGLDQLEHAVAQGNGVIVLVAHYPSLELAGRLLNLTQNPPVLGMARKHNNPLLDAALERGRHRHCERTFSKKDTLGLMRALKKGRAVFYAADQNFNHGFVFAPFFGVTASCVTALADLAERTDSTVVPMWCDRLADGHYRIELEPSWVDYPGDDRVASARRMNQWIERKLGENPAHYLWLHRRFKNQPEGSAPFYPERARRRKHRD